MEGLVVRDTTPRPQLEPQEIVADLGKSQGRLLIGVKESGAERGECASGEKVIPRNVALEAESQILNPFPQLERIFGVVWEPERVSDGEIERGVSFALLCCERYGRGVRDRVTQEHPNVDYVEPEYSDAPLPPGSMSSSSLSMVDHWTNDGNPATEDHSWGNDTLRVPSVWSNGYDGSGMEIAIVDTGIDRDPTRSTYILHPDWGSGGVFYNHVDNYSGACSDPGDPCYFAEFSHGSDTYGHAGAATNDTLTEGAAPGNFGYRMHKVGYTDQSGDYRQPTGEVAHAIEVVTTDVGAGADVHVAAATIQMDPDGTYSSVKKALDEAEAQGITMWIVAAGTGIEGRPVMKPAEYESVVAVSAVDQSLDLASSSSFGPDVEISAPGPHTWATCNRADGSARCGGIGGSGEGVFGGTSSATALALGVATLLADRFPGWSNQTLRSELQDHARDLGSTGRDEEYGYGLIDADCLVLQVTPCNP